jgi:hypothetical protein
MFTVELDGSEIEAYVSHLELCVRDQIPYALSLALNQAAENTRQVLIQDTWPNAIDQHNTGFIRASLLRGPRATKNDLQVSIYDALGRGHLKELALGGVHTPKSRARLAVPTQNVTRTSHGAPTQQKPVNLTNSFVVDRGRGPVLYQKQGKRLKLMYVLKTSVPIPAMVPFFEDFKTSMETDLYASLPAAMTRAILTRRK